VHDVKPAAQVIADVMEEAAGVLARLHRAGAAR
jgi:hypothetical protein